MPAPRSTAKARGAGRAGAPTPPARKEIKFYGVNACLALWQQRPSDVIRIYLLKALIPRFSAVLRWAAAERKAYHIVENEDLEKLTESVHHQGVCMLALEHPRLNFTALQQRLRDDKTAGSLITYLDGVENPHNFGAIVRSCAHFGIRYVIGERSRLPLLSPSACRVAEGGAEHVEVVYLDDARKQLKTLQSMGYALLATSVDQGEPLYAHRFQRRSILALGAEESGVSSTLRTLADLTLNIPGSGNVESLNVAAAFAVFAGEYFRQSTFAKRG